MAGMPNDTVIEKTSESVRRALLETVPMSPTQLLLTEASRTLYDEMHISLLDDLRNFMPSVLCILSCEIVGGEENLAMPAACAIGMIETMRVIYDELICMRENNDTQINHVCYGEAMNILAGGSLLTLAFQHITKGMDKATVMEVERKRIVRSIGELGRAASALITTSRGQAIEQIYECSAVVGAIVGGGSEYQIQKMGKYGRYIGRALDSIKSALDELIKPRFDRERNVPCFDEEKVDKLYWLTDDYIAFACTGN